MKNLKQQLTEKVRTKMEINQHRNNKETNTNKKITKMKIIKNNLEI